MRLSALPLALLLCLLVASATAEESIVKTLADASSSDSSGCSQKADIFFAIDSSHSVGRDNFKKVTMFVQEIVSQLLRRSTDFRFGFVVYSDKADMVMKLKDYSITNPKERDAMLQFITTELRYKSGKTVTGEAFQLIREQGFLQENGHREDAKPVVVLLTDGRANGRADPVSESKKLRDMGASVVALGIGSGISRQRLELFSDQKRFVSIVKDFSDLGKVSRVITDTLCDGDGATSDKEPCEPGLELVAGKCVPSEPKCKKKCPKGYLLVAPCKCTPNLEGKSECKKECKDTEILVKGCICVPRLSTIPKKPKVCEKKCGKFMTLDKLACKCECLKKCPGGNFELRSDCSCVCKMRCRPGLALNKKTCECDKIHCKDGMEFLKGKCRPKVKRFCEEGQVLIDEVCKKGHCPKGYKLKIDRKCYKVGCSPGYKKTKEGKCVKMCADGKYYFKGTCHEPKKCGLHEYFKVKGPGCQPTCNEPVLVSRCKNESEPQCVCQPYLLRHEGKCVHPSECPNIPICIQKADVVFMLDSSLTVTEHNFYLIKNFVRDVVQQFYLKDGKRQRVGVLVFNHDSKILLDLDSWKHNSHEEILKTIENIKYQPGLTFLGEALHKVRTKMWNRLAGMRSDVPRVTLLLTDGASTNGEVDHYYEARKLRESGSFFVTVAIGSMNEKSKKQFSKLAGPEGRVFMFGLREFQDLHSLVARVISFHCEKPLCPHPYLVRGDCIGNYRSISQIEYVPEEFTCKKVVNEKFKKERCACPKPTVSSADCNNMFKNVTTTYYTLNPKKGVCESKARDSVVRCGCPKGGRNVGACKDQFRTITTFSYKLRKGSSEGYECKKIEKKESRRCSCPKPIREYQKCVNNFKILHETVWEFEHTTRRCIKRSRTKEIRCSCPKPAVDTGHCNGTFVPVKIYTQKVNLRNQCDEIMWTGSVKCKRTCTDRIDVAFVVDSSDSVRGVNFEYIRRFIVAIAEKLDVSRDNTHVALLKYSSVNKMKVIFNYIAHYSLDSIKQRVMAMRYSPGTTYTGDALQNFRRFLLNKVNGYRGDAGEADSIAILITDGASNSKIDPQKEAAKIKALGSRILTVGVGEDIQTKQLDAIASSPADIHSFKTSSFSDLTDPAFVDEVIAATCRVGKVNKVWVKKKYTNKIRDYQARGIEIDWNSWGFTKVDPKDLAQFSFKLKGAFVDVVGETSQSRSRFLDYARNTIALRLRVHPFAIRKLHISRKMVLSGLVRDIKIPKIKSLVTSNAMKINMKEKQVLVDATSFQTMPHATLEVVRQATEAADIVLSVIRPLRRLVNTAETAAPLIKREDARSLAEEELKKLKEISSKADDLVDKLITLSNEARKTRDQEVAKKCLSSFKIVMAAAAKVARHIGYIAFFSHKGNREVMERRIEIVNTRILNAFNEIGIAEKLGLKAAKPAGGVAEPAAGGDGKAAAEAAEKPEPTAKKSASGAAEKSASGAAEKSASGAAEKSASGADEKSASGADEKSASGADEKSASGADEKTAATPSGGAAE